MADTLEDQGTEQATDPANKSPDYVNRLQGKTPSGGGGGGLSRFAGLPGAIGAFVGRNKKGVGIGGGIAGVFGILLLLLLSLLPLKLINLREVWNQYFGARQDHQASHAMGKIWTAVADKDGNVTLHRSTGHQLLDHI